MLSNNEKSPAGRLWTAVVPQGVVSVLQDQGCVCVCIQQHAMYHNKHNMEVKQYRSSALSYWLLRIKHLFISRKRYKNSLGESSAFSDSTHLSFHPHAHIKRNYGFNELITITIYYKIKYKINESAYANIDSSHTSKQPHNCHFLNH